MKPGRAASTCSAAALAALTLGLSCLGIVALNNGGSAPLLKLATGYDRRAEKILAAEAVPAGSTQEEAIALSRAAAAEFPYDVSAWLRLAYVDSLGAQGLTPRGLAMLQRSYDLVAVDPQVGVWRVGFALENSQSLSPPLRAAVRKETDALWLIGKKRSDLKQLATAMRNPAGRLSLRLWLNRLDSGVAR